MWIDPQVFNDTLVDLRGIFVKKSSAWPTRTINLMILYLLHLIFENEIWLLVWSFTLWGNSRWRSCTSPFNLVSTLARITQ